MTVAIGMSLSSSSPIRPFTWFLLTTGFGGSSPVMNRYPRRPRFSTQSMLVCRAAKYIASS